MLQDESRQHVEYEPRWIPRRNVAEVVVRKQSAEH